VSLSDARPKISHNSMCLSALFHVLLGQAQKRHEAGDVTKSTGGSYF
jgi:hypothetical protein